MIVVYNQFRVFFFINQKVLFMLSLSFLFADSEIYYPRAFSITPTEQTRELVTNINNLIICMQMEKPPRPRHHPRAHKETHAAIYFAMVVMPSIWFPLIASFFFFFFFHLIILNAPGAFFKEYFSGKSVCFPVV